MSSAGSPPHLLLLDKALGNELIDGRFREAGRYALTESPTFAVVDDQPRWEPNPPSDGCVSM
jgi:hypothetical protein